ncbi:alpha/beta fold hydrolase [Bdellovibrio sp. NC01]|uniref:alpha/beta fold hydrolase n=1 Tax=Bdellovibrio sp. NC01 TaxID=2220073 RepID=UPI0011573157|nr:alpha/beta hydrolase [Bdellovibrio sp. NC01]QDK37566.1 hypothetical protein DOE51_08200 [Bdellovibrio sp. NC01]
MINKVAVFLPGTLCDERLFAAQVRLFSQAIVVDLRHSDSVDQMIEAVGAVNVAKFVLLGFSMGGYIAQEFALKYPERVEKLIVMGSSSEGYPEEEKRIVESSIEIIKKGKFTGITDKRLKEYLYPSSYENTELRQVIHDMAGPDAKEVYLRQLRATLDRRELKHEMNHLSLPALFVGGADDKIVPFTSIERSANVVPKGQLAKISECGHFIPLEQPEALNKSITDFLNNK